MPHLEAGLTTARSQELNFQDGLIESDFLYSEESMCVEVSQLSWHCTSSPGTILPSLRGVQRGQVPATPEKKGHDQRVRGPDFGSIAVETKENGY